MDDFDKWDPLSSRRCQNAYRSVQAMVRSFPELFPSLTEPWFGKQANMPKAFPQINSVTAQVDFFTKPNLE